MPILDDASKEDNILVVAAEASSCMYAIRFMDEWKKSFPSHQFFGIGDQNMAQAGMDCQGYAEDLAVVGLMEVISHWTEIKDTFNSILEECEKRKPKYALLLDYPGFNLRLAKKLKEMGVTVVYYISPQLWAWKKGRVKQVQQYVDDMLVVFPFEVDFYKKHAVNAHFVGHPLVEVVDDEVKSVVQRSSGKPVLGLMPGSRNSEIGHNFLVQLKAAHELKKRQDIQIKVLVAPTLQVDSLKILAGELSEGVDYVKASPTDMIQGCDFILTASGTATLQVALCEKPMIVMYRMNPMTAVLAKLLVRDVEAFCIVNLISDEKFIPEFFQNEANPKVLSEALEKILVDVSYKENMMKKLNKVKTILGEVPATKNVVDFLKKKYY